MTSFVGRDVTVEFSIAPETASVGALSWSVLGMIRGKKISQAWDVVDVTADKSPAYTKQSLVTFKSITLSMDGVAYTDALHNQATLKAHVINPGSTTGNQPKAWFRVTGPDGTLVGPAIITKWDDDRPYDNGATWSIEAQSNGAFTFTPA